MVMYRRLFTTEMLSLFLTLMVITATVDGTKIAYKKAINGKVHVIKTKPLKQKTTEDTTAPNLTPTPHTSIEATLKMTSTAAPSIMENLEAAESIHALKTVENVIKSTEKPTELDTTPKVTEQLEQMEATIATKDENASVELEITSKEIEKSEPLTEIPENRIEEDHIVVDETLVIEHVSDVIDNGTEHIEEPSNSIEQPANITTESTYVETTTASKRPVSCTCGVFMTSQIKRTGNPYEPPIGKPVITNELDRVFPCNAVGQKQCQTKCLEAIVQHLPNSAAILCATLDRDIRKERAYLYIKNCRNQWFNTNLAAGREYCCKNGEPYQCPLV